MAKRLSIKEQFRRNAVALISLFVAISGLGYNTWRNEESEHNRNQRLGAFEMLEKIGEFEQVVWNLHYDKSDFGGTGRTGWALVRTIDDIAVILDQPIPDKSKALHEAWEKHSPDLGRSDTPKIGNESASIVEIREAVEELRYATRMQLLALD